MGAALEALTALEVTVRGRSATLFRRQLVGIHRKAHRAARLAPLEAGLDEDLVEAFGFRLLLHETRARHHHGDEDAVEDEPVDDLRGRAQLFDATGGARAEE